MWYINRLKAMSIQEVCWRVAQKRLQSDERRLFDKQKNQIISNVFDKHLESLKFNPSKIGINYNNITYNTKTEIHLLGGYKYERFKDKWKAGFQTEKEWSNKFSYFLNYKQRDEIGDARTNWELNRHFQFALLAKAFYVTDDKKYISDLNHLFFDWNYKNCFLHGISWTSVMEIAIRCIQWCLTLSFLSEKNYSTNEPLLLGLNVGIKNMASYIVQHYSRFSSANNHLLVEATAIAYAGFAFNYPKWQQLAINILDGELNRQNYSDGINKEMSLHYQTFGMEAYALVMMLMKRNNITIPQKWIDFLSAQCQFVKYSMINDNDACEFGDNDEGKIIDLEGGDIYHYQYILQLCSLVLGSRYEKFEHISETISWMFSEKEISECKLQPIYKVTESKTFPEGGYSFLRDIKGKIIIGIDHAPLGFGSIAAHGHADALSFQLYVDGQCILGDPGTFIYHCNLLKRNEYRKSCNHNTVWTKDNEQSQMMGAFLWGKKAKTRLLNTSSTDDYDLIQAECLWQNGFKHIRSYKFDKKEYLDIDDIFYAKAVGFASFIISPRCSVTLNENIVNINYKNITVKIKSNSQPKLFKSLYSNEYGIEQATNKIVYELNNNKLNTRIWIEKY